MCGDRWNVLSSEWRKTLEKMFNGGSRERISTEYFCRFMQKANIIHRLICLVLLFLPPGLHFQIPQKTDFYNVSAFSVEYVRLGRLHSVSPAGLSCKPTYIHYVFLSEAGWVSSFCPISAPWFRDKSLWLRENQPARRRWRWALGNYPPTHNISIWDFRDFSRHFTDDIFKRPTLFIYLK